MFPTSAGLMERPNSGKPEFGCKRGRERTEFADRPFTHHHERESYFNNRGTKETVMKKLWAMLASPLIIALGVTAACAQGYPNKPVRLVLPYSPGGIVDYVGRTLATHMSGPLGQQVVAENRPGAGGIAGTDAVARSAPDGYTLVIMDPAIVINPTLQPSVPYDLFKQLTTVSLITSSPEVLVVAAELLKQRAGVEATHVPYRGIGQAFPDMMTNKVQFAFSSIAGALPFTQDNRVRALATTGAKRSPVYPDLPTVDRKSTRLNS